MAGTSTCWLCLALGCLLLPPAAPFLRMPVGPRAPSPALRPSTALQASASHLSILELLKATIGLQSGPWGLPVSNTSVVRLLTAREVWNETEPWRRYPVGFKRPVSTAIALVDHDDSRKSRYLLTADHVLASYFRITAWHPGLPAPAEGERPPEFRARVLSRSTEWDVALLTVDDDAFWEGIEALPLHVESTIKPESLVTVAGYTNRTLTANEWLVQGYSMGPDCLNLDLYRPGGVWDRSAMPFGCSGGPILAQSKMGYSIIGMLSAGEPDRPVLHCVPAHLIQRFIAHYQATQDAEFRGGCRPGFGYQPLASAFLRERLGLGASGSGVLVTAVDRWAADELPLRRGDVILAMDGAIIGEDGRVSLPNEKLVAPLHAMWDFKSDGDAITFKVLREGRIVQLEGTARRAGQLVPQVSPPRSFAFVGGLLFLPASQTKVAMNQDRVNRGAPELQAVLKTEPRDFRDEELVLLWRIYPHEVNEGYEERLSRLLRFNGHRVRNVQHLNDLLQASREEGEDEWLEFELEDSRQVRIVLPAFQAWAAEEGMRRANRIPAVRPLRAQAEAEEGSSSHGNDDSDDDSDLEDDVIGLE